MQREHPLSAVRFRRDLLGIKATAIARRLGIEPASYSRIERGERRIYLDRAIALASMLHCGVRGVHDLSVIPDEAERNRLWDVRQSQASDKNGTLVSGTTPPIDDDEGDVEYPEIDLSTWDDDDD